MEINLELRRIYRNTAIAVIIAAILMVGGVFAYEYHMGYVKLFSQKTVKEQAISESNGTASAAAQTSEITATAGTQVDTSSIDGRDYLMFNTASSDSQFLWIPLPEGMGLADVAIENHYMSRELWISVGSTDTSFYDKESISGDLSGITYGEVVAGEESMILKFALDDVYEFNTIFENGVLYVEKMRPRELYNHLIVIDPCGQIPEAMLNAESMTPTRICLDIADKLREKLENDGLRVYVTSVDERAVTDEDRISLISAVRPDMLVRIDTAFDEDSKVYGTQTVYNGTYFIPGFGSVELADLLEQEVTTAIGGKAVGLVEAGEDDTVIRKATIPAATVKVGFYTNAQENILLNREDYRGKIAQGMYKAVMSGLSDE